MAKKTPPYTKVYYHWQEERSIRYLLDYDKPAAVSFYLLLKYHDDRTTNFMIPEADLSIIAHDLFLSIKELKSHIDKLVSTGLLRKVNIGLENGKDMTFYYNEERKNDLINQYKAYDKKVEDGLKSQQKQQENKKEFTPPTREEVEEYCKGKNICFDVERFFERFTSNDWTKDNGDKIKSWKALINAISKNNQ